MVEKLRRLPAAFSEALIFLMDWRDCTVEEVAEGAQTSGRTVQRLRTGQLRPTLKRAVALCVALQLPFAFSLEMMKKADPHPYSEDYLVYLELLPEMYKLGMDMFEFNDALEECGALPIGQND
jgi:transcriptional regulator with XRE-family HTH domain